MKNVDFQFDILGHGISDQETEPDYKRSGFVFRNASV